MVHEGWSGEGAGAVSHSSSLDTLLGAGCTGLLLTLLPLPAAHIAEDASNLLQRVAFQSSNFENILTWDSGLESSPDTVYSVEYKTYAPSQHDLF